MKLTLAAGLFVAASAAAMAATPGAATPTVQTTAKARINTKTLNITGVPPATGSCGANR